VSKQQENALLLRYPHKKKSAPDRSRDLAGHIECPQPSCWLWNTQQQTHDAIHTSLPWC